MSFGQFLIFVLGILACETSCQDSSNDAPYYSHPYIVSLRGTYANHFCSGSILNEHWILTAAHCVENRDPDIIKAHVGSNFLSTLHDVYTIDAVVIHEDYKPVRNSSVIWNDDIALLRTTRRIAFNDYVKQTVLPESYEDPVSYGATIVGWGDTKSGRRIPDKLQEIHSTFSNCEQVFPSKLSTICTESSTGICHNDAGSPVLDMGVQVGISSYTFPCSLSAKGVHTKVRYYKNWMSHTMERYEIKAMQDAAEPSRASQNKAGTEDEAKDSSSTIRLNLFVLMSAACIVLVDP